MKCGGGIQNAKFECVEDKAGKVSSTFCAGEDKPQAATKKCNEQPCLTKLVDLKYCLLELFHFVN